MKPNLIQLPSIPEVGFVLFIYLFIIIIVFYIRKSKGIEHKIQNFKTWFNGKPQLFLFSNIEK